MKVTWNSVWNLTLSDCFGKKNKTFVVVKGIKLLKLFSANCYLFGFLYSIFMAENCDFLLDRSKKKKKEKSF